MRRRALITVVISVLLLALVNMAPTTATSARSVGGKIRMGAPFGTPMSALLCAWHLDHGQAQGALAWVVPLTSNEGDGHHAFALDTGRGLVAIDGSTHVEFFAAQDPCVGARRLQPTSEASADSEESRDFVPRDATHAVVFAKTFFFPGVCYFPCFAAEFGVNRPFRLTIWG